ncbi:hypothetical protein JF50_03465 [Pseudoalteromonas luteoviolacea]|uniref:Uncharacterized protein n=1 Tax=Pseudoalteromonas luteoviolacea TaxID=43657 RepID=A0A0C1MSL6_9GAMM|nr:hypothetical protein [Pseudoalteromonas luteoviolacea]KID57823.1 hypothetical protein JF50_03465 [Pseudoalteromonas luteoviolacea]
MQRKLFYYASLMAFLLSPISVSAWQVGGTYFKSGSTEVKVKHTSSSNRINSLKFDITCYSSQCNRDQEIYTIMYNFVSAVRNNRLYTYRSYTPPPGGCTEQACRQPEMIDLDDEYSMQNAGVGSTRSRILEGLVTGAAAEVGSTSISAITNKLIDKSKNSNSLATYIITAKVIGGQRKPISMCKVSTAGTCDIEEDVVFTHKSGDRVDSSFRLRDGSTSDLRRQLHILESFNSFKMRCRTTYTGSGLWRVVNMVCYPE